MSAALNSGVPLTLTGNSEHGDAVRQLHPPARRPDAAESAPAQPRRSAALLGFEQTRVPLVTDHELPCSAPPPAATGPAAAPAAAAPAGAARRSTSSCKANVHRKLLNRLNLEALAQADRARAESEIRTLVGELLAEEGAPLSLGERETLFGERARRGLRPRSARAAAARPDASATSWSTRYKQVFVERNGKLERVPTSFQDDRHLLRVIDRIVSGVGRRIDDSSPMVDARLPDGSRVNAIIPPLAVDGPLLSIRRFPAERLKAEDLVTLRALTPADARLPVALRRARG